VPTCLDFALRIVVRVCVPKTRVYSKGFRVFKKGWAAKDAIDRSERVGRVGYLTFKENLSLKTCSTLEEEEEQKGGPNTT
jgi:hypothetical protein